MTFCFIAGTRSQDLFAQSVYSTVKDPQYIPKTEKGYNLGRHKKPSLDRVAIRFYYENDVVYFTMPDYITCITVSMEGNDGEIFSSYVYAVNPFWSITLTPGEYHIECDADEGSHFEGSVNIN